MRDHDGFTTLLGKHFRHNNYKSWVRQLNFYGFRKMRFDEAEGGDRSLDDDLGAMPLEGGQFEDTGSNLPPATPAVVKLFRSRLPSMRTSPPSSLISEPSQVILPLADVCSRL